MTMNVYRFNSNFEPTLSSFCEFSFLSRPSMSVLCVGPRNSGKTMLLNSIQYPDSINFTTHSVNTVGTNLYTINNSAEKSSRKAPKKSLTIRELGGEMAVMWKNYYTESVEKIMFVVDTSNLCQISCAGELIRSRLWLSN